MEDMKSLIIKNSSFDEKYGLSKFDLEKVNRIISVIEANRTEDPEPGDIIQCIGPKAKYLNGHLERPITEKYSTICVKPHIPFTSIYEHKNGTFHVYFDSSGGYWVSCTDRKMYEYIGKSLKTFKTWGHRGHCAGGAVEFQAVVNIWKIFKESIY
jgi:hypothetical protein